MSEPLAVSYELAAENHPRDALAMSHARCWQWLAQAMDLRFTVARSRADRGLPVLKAIVFTLGGGRLMMWNTGSGVAVADRIPANPGREIVPGTIFVLAPFSFEHGHMVEDEAAAATEPHDGYGLGIFRRRRGTGGMCSRRWWRRRRRIVRGRSVMRCMRWG